MTALEKDDLAHLRRLGRLEAESFDAALREEERREREEHLTHLAAAAEDDDATAELFHASASHAPGELSGAAWRLQQDLERLTAFHQAVVHSRAWRLIQAARRLVGRAW